MHSQLRAICVLFLGAIVFLLLAADTPLAGDAAEAPNSNPTPIAVASAGAPSPTTWLDELVSTPGMQRAKSFLDPHPVRLGVAVLGIGLILAGIVFLARSRLGRGVATLHIDFPELAEGDFQVSLKRRARRSRASGHGPTHSASRPFSQERKRPLGRSRYTRHGVSRETQFDGLMPGPWIARIEGTLQAPHSSAKLADIDESVEFEILAESVTPVRIPLPEVKRPVELRIHWDRLPATEIGVCLRGRPETLRYSGHGISRLRLGLGTHSILVGAGDRIVERTLRVDDYEPRSVRIDLATSDGLVFKGCPPAVSCFLQGDLGGAARALGRDDQSEIASLLLAQLHQEQGQIEHAAEALEDAGKPREAADLRRSIDDHERAGELYERAGAEHEAADMYAAAGAWSQAARVYGALEDWDNAVHAFERAGDREGLIDALEAQGALLRAAGFAAENGDRARAIRLLQQIGPKDPDHGRASELLVLAFEQEGHLDLAANQLERRLDLMESNESAPQLEFHLAELLEEIGDDERALDILEILRDREPTYPKVATRIEGLRKKLSESRSRGTNTSFSQVPGATAFVSKARYEILEEIGRGGMGRVYKARDRRLGREVALKRMPDNLHDHPTAVSLFLGEAQAAARMNHPNIVTLYDADQEKGHFFITMELLHGLPLNALLKRHGAFDAVNTARLGLQACAGLAYAHDQGIIHRDIKTANLFITKDRALKIMDFGLAKVVEAVRENGETVIAGTPHYMAPEQSAGHVVDGRTDLYALGVTLFEISTGRLPFTEGPVAEQHRLAPPPDPTTIVPGYPSELAGLIQQMLGKRPEDRPSNASEVAHALSAFLDTSMNA